MPSLRVSPRLFLILCRITLATVVLNIVTGAAVPNEGLIMFVAATAPAPVYAAPV